MMKIKLPPAEVANIRKAADSPNGKTFLAAYRCTCRGNIIVFDGTVRVTPKIGELVNRTSPSGVLEIPSYIPEDSKFFTFLGAAEIKRG